jgi:hypothetical protein
LLGRETNALRVSPAETLRVSPKGTRLRERPWRALALTPLACALRLRSRLCRETPSGSPDAWLSGDPPAALVSPPAALSHQIPRSGDPPAVLAPPGNFPQNSKFKI